LGLDLFPQDVVYDSFHRHVMRAEEDWDAFRSYLRKLLFDVTKPTEEKGGVVVVNALQNTSSYSIDFEVSRYMAIVEEIGLELEHKNFRRVEIVRSREVLKTCIYTSSPVGVRWVLDASLGSGRMESKRT
jgi:hypothetical protein